MEQKIYVCQRDQQRPSEWLNPNHCERTVGLQMCDDACINVVILSTLEGPNMENWPFQLFNKFFFCITGTPTDTK